MYVLFKKKYRYPNGSCARCVRRCGTARDCAGLRDPDVVERCLTAPRPATVDASRIFGAARSTQGAQVGTFECVVLLGRELSFGHSQT